MNVSLPYIISLHTIDSMRLKRRLIKFQSGFSRSANRSHWIRRWRDPFYTWSWTKAVSPVAILREGEARALLGSHGNELRSAVIFSPLFPLPTEWVFLVATHSLEKWVATRSAQFHCSFASVKSLQESHQLMAIMSTNCFLRPDSRVAARTVQATRSWAAFKVLKLV